MDKRGWNYKTDKLRIHSSQRFEDLHPRRPASVSKRRDSGTNGFIGRNSPLGKRRETVSGIAAKDPFGIGDENGRIEEPKDRAQAVDTIQSLAENESKGKERETGSYQSPLLSPYTLRVPSPAVKERLDKNRRRRANTALSRIPVPTSKANRWGTGHRNSPKVKDDLDHDSELHTSEYECMENSHKGLQALGLLTLDDNENDHQDRAVETKRYSEGGYPPKLQPKRQDSDHKSKPSPSNSGDAFSNDSQPMKWNSTVLDTLGERKSDHGLLSTPNQKTDETNDRTDNAVSDKGEKCNKLVIPSETPPNSNRYESHSADFPPQPYGSESTLIGARPNNEPVKEHFHEETNGIKEETDAPKPPGTRENVSHDAQLETPRDNLTKNIDPQDPSPESGQNKESDTTQSPNTAYFPERQIPDGQLKSPGNDHMKDLNPQPKSPDNVDRKSAETQPKFPGDDHITRPDAQPISPGKDDMRNLDPQSKISGSDHVDAPKSKPHSPESGGVTAKTVPVQDQAGKDDDSEAWLDSDAPLPGNYRALFHDSQRRRSFRPNRSSPPGDGKDSLIVSPAGSVRQPCSQVTEPLSNVIYQDENKNSDEEDWNSTAIANDEIIRMLDEYRENSRLEPASDGQEAKYLRRAEKEADKLKRSLQGTDPECLSVSTPSSDGSLVMSPVGRSSPSKKHWSLTSKYRARTMREGAPTPSLYMIISRRRSKMKRRRREEKDPNKPS